MENEKTTVESPVVNEEEVKTQISDGASDKAKTNEVETAPQTEPVNKSQTDLDDETRKRNAKFAEERRRREAEERQRKTEEERQIREQEIREEATLKAELNLIKKNPYTNQDIKDADDLKIYKMQKELEDEGKDPIADLASKIAENNRKSRAIAKQKAEEESNNLKKIESEIKELKDKYPDVNTAILANDPEYQHALKGKAGRWTQLEIYEYYLSQKKVSGNNDAKNKIVDKVVDKVNAVPSSMQTGVSTQKTVSNMTDEEFEVYWRNKYKR